MSTIVEVVAEIWYEPPRLIGDEVEGGYWHLAIATPDGESEWSADSPAKLVDRADRWGLGRGVEVTIRILGPAGGHRPHTRAVDDAVYHRHPGGWRQCGSRREHAEHQLSYSPWKACPGVKLHD